MKIDSKTGLLGLLGSPSRHSLSPFIQNTFLSYYGINCIYLAFEPDEHSLKQVFEGAAGLEFTGLNVTMPFKDKVYRLVDDAEGSAAIIKAVNTVKFCRDLKGSKNLSSSKNYISRGYSTDGNGFIKSLEDFGFAWGNKSCLVIGAGGAASSTIFEVLKKNLKNIYIFDVDVKKASSLKEIISGHLSSDTGVRVLENIKHAEEFYDEIDLIVNCTPAGMKLESFPENINKLPVPEGWSLKDKYVFDMVYNPLETALLKKAKKDNAAQAISGIYMLVNQAAFSFKIWFNIMPGEKILKKIISGIKRGRTGLW